METKELEDLVIAFKEYRDLLIPIQSGLKNFTDSFDGLKLNLENMNNLFEGDINGKLDKLYTTLYSQSQKATDLSTRINTFIMNTDKYTETINKLTNKFSQIELTLTKINEIEAKAESQIKILDNVLQEKKINYNIKDLQKSLESYNNNVQKVSEFINVDVAEKLKENSDKIQQIKNDNNNIKELIENQTKDISTLIEYYKSTTDLIKTSVSKEGVNEEYLFEILDKWAISRKVKVKQK